MKHFSEEDRYIYDLNENSIVVDAGGYEGNWFKGIYERYKCKILVFEPVYENYLKCCLVAWGLTRKTPFCLGNKISILHAALSDKFKSLDFGTAGDSAGVHNSSEERQHVSSDKASVILWMNRDEDAVIDLLKLNIEGMEYEVIQDLYTNGKLKLIKNIQVQCHFNHEGAKEKYAKMREQLLETHEPEWDSEPVWQNYRLKY